MLQGKRTKGDFSKMICLSGNNSTSGATRHGKRVHAQKSLQQTQDAVSTFIGGNSSTIGTNYADE